MAKPFKVTTKIPPIQEIDNSSGELNLYDPENPDIGLFNLIDDEIIKLSGSKFHYYKYFRSESYDPVYMEDRAKPLSIQPITVVGHYNPVAIEEKLGQFGIELSNDQIFIFNKSYIERILNRSPIPGDIIKPYFQEQKYEIFEVQEDSFEVYGVYHLNCHAKLLRDYEDVHNRPITDVREDI